MKLIQLTSVGSGSALFFCLKLGLVHLINRHTNIAEWLNYALVTAGIFPLGWIYHSKISFRMNLSVETLKRYIHQALGLKLLDYLIFNASVYLLGAEVMWSVILSTAIIFLLRILTYFKYVFIRKVEG